MNIVAGNKLWVEEILGAMGRPKFFTIAEFKNKAREIGVPDYSMKSINTCLKSSALYAGYVPLSNPNNAERRWKIGDRRVYVYRDEARFPLDEALAFMAKALRGEEKI